MGRKCGMTDPKTKLEGGSKNKAGHHAGEIKNIQERCKGLE